MTPIGMGLAFIAYAGGVWGYCLLRGYNVTPADLFKNTWPGLHLNITPPTGGHSLGTINGSTSTTNPSQLLGPQGGTVAGALPTVTPQGITPGNAG